MRKYVTKKTGWRFSPFVISSALKGGGQPLPPNQRTFYESRMGHDFSGVRIHAGTQAADTAQAVQAKAFTLGNNIVFNTGQYSPNNQEGNKLLAHELTHVVQQEQNQYSKIQKQGEAEAVEYDKEFDVFALDLKKAMEPLGTDEEAIFHVLQEARRIPSGLDKLKKAYKKHYKVSLGACPSRNYDVELKNGSGFCLQGLIAGERFEHTTVSFTH
ncbi:hypothetical protein ES703_13373 [subsurface metagenome]